MLDVREFSLIYAMPLSLRVGVPLRQSTIGPVGQRWIV
jgi:hypothetical protein